MIGAGRVQVHFLEKIHIRFLDTQDFFDTLHVFYYLFPAPGTDHLSSVHKEIHGSVKTGETDVPGKETEGILKGKCRSAFRNRERHLFLRPVFPESIPGNCP